MDLVLALQAVPAGRYPRWARRPALLCWCQRLARLTHSGQSETGPTSQEVFVHLLYVDIREMCFVEVRRPVPTSVFRSSSSTFPWQRSSSFASHFGAVRLQLLSPHSATLLLFRSSSSTFPWQRSSNAASHFGAVRLQLLSSHSATLLPWQRSSSFASHFGALLLQLCPLCSVAASRTWYRPTLTGLGGCSPRSCFFFLPFLFALFLLAAFEPGAEAWRRCSIACGRGSNLFYDVQCVPRPRPARGKPQRMQGAMSGPSQPTLV